MMVYNANFSWGEMYNMPIYMRSFYINQYREWKEAENRNAEQANEQQQQQAHEAYLMGQQNSE